jgi:ribosomal protein S18 acetylase RimI-like enzyme
MNIRKAVLSDVDGIAKVQVACWKSTYAGIIPDEYIKKQTYEKRVELWKRVIPNGNVFVAEDEKGQIIGFADGGRERTGNYEEYKGEMYSLYILKSYQGRGIGKRLIKEVARALVKQDFHSMLVWVLKDNTSCHFYEKMGGQVVDRITIDFSGKGLVELAYGWKDIRSFK